MPERASGARPFRLDGSLDGKPEATDDRACRRKLCDLLSLKAGEQENLAQAVRGPPPR